MSCLADAANGRPYWVMTDRVNLAREIAARTQPRFIDIKAEPRVKRRVASASRFIEIVRGGLTAEQYRWKLIGKVHEVRTHVRATRLSVPICGARPPARKMSSSSC